MNRPKLRYLSPWRRQREEREMQEELASLREMAQPGELGSLVVAAENARQTWHFTSFTGVAADFRYALRMLRRQPGFVAVAVLSIALGVGVTSAVFDLVDAMLLRPLPVPAASRVLRVTGSLPTLAATDLSYPDYRDIRERSRSFAGLVAYRTTEVRLADGPTASPHLRGATMVSDGFFPVLGITPAIGRDLQKGEGGADAAVAVLDHQAWVREFGSNPAVVGRTLRVNGVPFTVVGVAPASFPGMGTWFSTRPFLFIPISTWDRLEGGGGHPLEDRSRLDLSIAGRLKPGVSRAAAAAELATIGRTLAVEHPTTNGHRRIVLRTELGMRMMQDVGTSFFSLTLMVLVGLLLCVACFNVAGLLLARAYGRSREIAIRLALGAGRIRLLRQLMTENLIVALLGGALGVGVAYAAMPFLNRFQPTGDSVGFLPGSRVDSRLLLFDILVALASCLLFGLGPALQTVSADLVSAIKAGGWPRARRRTPFGRNLLVIGQFAVTVVLLVVGGMMVESLRRTETKDLGFRRDHLVTLDTNPTVLNYSPERTRRFYRDLLERTVALPGVRSATLADDVPSRLHDYQVVPEGHRAPGGMSGFDVRAVVCDERYLATVGIPLVRGRGFTAEDRAETRRVAIVNEEFAQQYWPNRPAVGKRIRLEREDGPEAEVVGVLHFPGMEDLLGAPGPAVFLPYEQNRRARMAVIVYHQGDAAGFAAPLRAVVRALEPEHPVPEVRTLSSSEEEVRATWRTVIQWMLALGLTGLALALVGLYALMAYSVSRRTAEIGVRMALGSTRGAVLRLVIGEGMAVAAGGIAIAAALIGAVHAALGGTSLVQAIIVTAVATYLPPNAPTYVGVPLVVLAVSALATILLARRAATIDPLQALRHE